MTINANPFLPEIELRTVEDLTVAVADVGALIDEAALGKALTAVSPYRRDKALAYKMPVGRALSVGAALLTDVLLQRFGLRESDMTYVIGGHGKPRFAAHPELHFSISHSGRLAACAMGRREMGLDIQQPTKKRDEVVRRVCSEAEQEFLQAQGESAFPTAFARLWALKESWFKATGTGITDHYPAFELSGDAPRLTTPSAPCTFREFMFGPVPCALCVME